MTPHDTVRKWLADKAAGDYARIFWFKTLFDAWERCKDAEGLIWMLASLGAARKDLHLLAVRLVRETPVGFGRKTDKTVSDFLVDPRTLKALEVTERFACGEATEEELNYARLGSWLASDASQCASEAARPDALSAVDAVLMIAPYFASRAATEDVPPQERDRARAKAYAKAVNGQLRIIREAFPWPKVEALIETKATELGCPMATKKINDLA